MCQPLYKVLKTAASLKSKLLLFFLLCVASQFLFPCDFPFPNILNLSLFLTLCMTAIFLLLTEAILHSTKFVTKPFVARVPGVAFTNIFHDDQKNTDAF